MRHALFAVSHTEATLPEFPVIPIPQNAAKINNVDDLQFYLKLNHSQLLTSKLAWRPNLKEEFIVTIFGFSNQFC